MWCTRWFLPLLLLPLPTAPPYFLILFLFSLTIHAKPCFYCIVLLTTLFVSSCYWQPFPIESPLTTPWADNITTFSEALNATLKPSYQHPLPTVMRAVDRCWCDLSAGGFWEPFNVSHWEYLSVQRLSQELQRPQKVEESLPQGNDLALAHNDTQASGLNSTYDSINMSKPPTPLSTSNFTSFPSKFWFRLKSLSRKLPRFSMAELLSHEIDTELTHGIEDKPAPDEQDIVSPVTVELADLPLLRKEYDLRPYGLGLIIDLNWSR
ncbi:hypothetical protein B0H34DRAFT_683301 [Crassisporium funariophilum]|nr:hypothetical protein B0H34DRAFT_683301 [Crassisporium funariophilum]